MTVAQSPLVSVIIPAYNAAAHLREALESVFAQDWRPFEVVLVDDGSGDETGAIAQSFPQVRYIPQENAGASAARNTALAASVGDFVANFDADDVLPANRLSLQATYLVQHSQIGCVLGRQEWINPPEWFTRDSVYGDVDGIPLSSAMFRRDVLLSLGGYDTAFSVGEDTDVLIRMRERGIEYAILPEIVLFRRYHDGSAAARNPHAQLIQSLRAKLDRQRTT